MPSFSQRLSESQLKAGSALCVGLDPDLGRMPAHLLSSRTPEAAVEHFCRAIVEATTSVVCAYKLNFAFFERLGDRGTTVLRRVRESIPSYIPTIADAKRGDIGNSARFYAGAAIADLGFDSVTVSPYMGRDSVLPFIQQAGTAAFVLVRTSNPGRADIQDLIVRDGPLYREVAKRAVTWGKEAEGEIGFVVGASDLDALARLRSLAPETPFLIPGVGAQGGSPTAVMATAGSLPGTTIVNSSRAICYASDGEDFAEAAQRAAHQAAELLRVNGQIAGGHD